MTKQNTYKLTTSAILIALSTVLSLIKVFQMPLGGSVTPLSMLPVCLIGIFYGTKYSVLPCLIFSFIQMFVSNPFAWGLTPFILVGCILFDYVLAFSCLCLSGIFKKYGDVGILCGVALACFTRFVCHFISGCIFFSNLEQWGFFGAVFSNRPILYSLCYNGFYMLPELVITVIGTLVLLKSGAVAHILKYTERK